MTAPAAWRSVLYVPGDKPRAIEKARGLRADAIILDLEDAVAPEAKVQAREQVRLALRAGGWRVPVLVRVNGLGTEHEHADREMALLSGAAGLVYPSPTALIDEPPPMFVPVQEISIEYSDVLVVAR